MKILFIGKYNTTEILSGPEKVAKRLFEHIAVTNPDSQFITYFFKGLKISTITNRLFGKQLLNENPQVFRYGILPIIFFLVFNRPQIIHIITFERFQIPIIISAKLLRIKIIYTVHGIYRYERELFYKKPSLLSEFKDLSIEKLIFKKSDSLVFLSSQMIKLTEKYYKIDKYKNSIIPNGVSFQKISVNKRFDFSDRLEIVFYNGLGSSRKRGLEDLITILSKEKRGSFHLSILGCPINTNYNQIEFINPLPEKLLFKFLNDKHVFIDNLSYIPFSIMALEAMSLGLIVIASNESGISSFIKDGENGFVFESENPDKIREILLDISSSKYNLELLSSNAIDAAKDLSWDRIATQYLSTYQELLK